MSDPEPDLEPAAPGFQTFAAETPPLVSKAPVWDVRVLNPDGNEFVLALWQSVDITENFEGSTGRISISPSDVALPYITELVSDILYYRNNRLTFRHRVLNFDDTLDREGHTLSIQTVSYENLLKKRVLHNTYIVTADQHDMAWDLIRITQMRQTLGITRASPARSGRGRRKVTIENGKTIYDAVDELASVENGFDWWIDADRRVHFQTPRRLLVHGFEWRWGRQVAEIDIDSKMADYSSSLYVMGASQETTIPQGKDAAGHARPDKKYPPPHPVYIEVTPRPYGRWEATFDLPDVVTKTSLTVQGRRELTRVSQARPSYRLTTTPVSWDPAMRPGGTFYLRAESPPRLNFRVLVRIEEISINLSAAGAEDVNMTAQAETTPTRINQPPLAAVIASDTSPTADEVVGDILPPMPYGSDQWGVTKTRSSVSPIDDMARSILGIQETAARATRSTIGDEGIVPADDPLDDFAPVFYGFNGEIWRAGLWNMRWPGEWFVALVHHDAVPPPSTTDPSTIPGVVTTATLESWGVETVNRITPIYDSMAVTAYAPKMQFSNSEEIEPVIPCLGAVFELVTPSFPAEPIQRFTATIVAGNESVPPGMSGAIYLNDGGVWGQATGTVTVGPDNFLRFSLFTTPTPPASDPERAQDHATQRTLDELDASNYQLAIESPGVAPVLIEGPVSDLVIPLADAVIGEETCVGITLPSLPPGDSMVYLSLSNPNGVELGCFEDMVTVAGGTVVYDSLVTGTDVPPPTALSSDGPIELGTRFHRAGTTPITVHGVRFYRSTVAQVTNPMAYLAPVGGAILASKAAAAATPAAAGWETVLFDTPITISTSTEHIVWIWLPSGGYYGTNAYLTDDKPSRLGQFVTPFGGGVFKQPPAGTLGNSEPVQAYLNSWYWVDLLVT